MIDRLSETCSTCDGSGTMQETSINDDRDGVLHCTNCGFKMPRFFNSINLTGETKMQTIFLIYGSAIYEGKTVEECVSSLGRHVNFSDCEKDELTWIRGEQFTVTAKISVTYEVS